MSGSFVEVLDTCRSTQDEVLTRLRDTEPGTIIAIRALSQQAGRGREGRAWQDPPGDALLLSVGVRGPLDITVLDALPARLGLALLEELAPHGQLRWKAPNDLVASVDGAKVAGILVDARTVGAAVDHVVVGLGCNLTGPRFTTADGRDAASLEATGAGGGDPDALAERIADAIRSALEYTPAPM